MRLCKVVWKPCSSNPSRIFLHLGPPCLLIWTHRYICRCMISGIRASVLSPDPFSASRTHPSAPTDCVPSSGPAKGFLLHILPKSTLPDPYNWILKSVNPAGNSFMWQRLWGSTRGQGSRKAKKDDKAETRSDPRHEAFRGSGVSSSPASPLAVSGNIYGVVSLLLWPCTPRGELICPYPFSNHYLQPSPFPTDQTRALFFSSHRLCIFYKQKY